MMLLMQFFQSIYIAFDQIYSYEVVASAESLTNTKNLVALYFIMIFSLFQSFPPIQCLICLQNQESKASDMEESYSQQVKTLKSKYEEESSRAENAERSVRKLEKDIENLEDELERERNKTKNLEEEMKTIMSDLNTI